MKKKAKGMPSMTGDAWSIANHYGEPWTKETWQQEDRAQSYLDSVRKQPWSSGLPKHRVVPVRVTIRFTKATLAALGKKKKS